MTETNKEMAPRESLQPASCNRGGCKNPYCRFLGYHVSMIDKNGFLIPNTKALKTRARNRRKRKD